MPQMLAAEEKMFRLKTKIPDMAGFSNKFGEVITLADFALAVYRLGWVFKMPTGIDELANVGVTVKSNDTAPSLGIGSG